MIRQSADGSRFFGKAGSPYDCKGVNLNQAREQCRELEAQQKAAGRKINTKVMNMIEGSVSTVFTPNRFELTPNQGGEEGASAQENDGDSLEG